MITSHSTMLPQLWPSKKSHEWICTYKCTYIHNMMVFINLSIYMHQLGSYMNIQLESVKLGAFIQSVIYANEHYIKHALFNI